MFFGEINKINLQLVLETFLASFLIASPVYKRRKHFVIKTILVTAIFCVLGYFFPSYYIENIPALNILYWTFMYTCLLLFSLPGLLVCFDMKFVNAFLISLTSYTIHHINNIFSSIITGFISIYSGIDTSSTLYSLINYSTQALVLIVTYVLFYYYYLKQRKENLQLVYNNKQLLFFAFIVVIFTIVISSGVRICYYSNDLNGVYIIGLVSNFASCLLVLIFFFVFLRSNKLQQELQIEKRIIEQEKKQYELSKENIDSLNIKFHDLKYRVNMLTSNNSQITKEDLKDIYDGIDVYESVVKTGNQALDVVLTQNALRAENNHIKFTSIADGKALSFMSNTDIYVLFGNAISNAIEATMKLKEEKRHISLVLKRKGNIVSIELENFFNPDNLKIIDGKIETSKSDKSYHGYGLKSMENIVRKYDGVMNTNAESDIFLLTMTFIVDN